MARPESSIVRPQDLGIGSLFESVRDAVIVAEASTGRIVLWNPAATEIFGYSPSEALDSLNVETLVPEHLRARHRAGLSRFHETGHGPYIDSYVVLDLPAVRKGGEEIGIELTLSPIEPLPEAEAEGHFVLAVVRDVTERKRAEEEVRKLNEELEDRVAERTAELDDAVARLQSSERTLRESEERYRLLVEGAKDYAIFMLDPEGRVTNWNEGARRLFGYEEGEIIGEQGSLLFTTEDRRRGADKEELRKARAEGRAQGERWYLRKDGSRFFASGFVRPVHDEGGNLIGFSKVARDITERKVAEDRDGFLADLNRALQPLTDPEEVTAAAARLLGEHLKADRCAYAEVEADEDHFRITGDYARGVPSIAGRFAMSAFGSEALRLSRENEPYVVDDAEADERVTATDLEAYRQTRIRAVISVPLHKGGRFVAGMAVHQKTPRRWSREEVELIKSVAERCWDSMERARAVRYLRRSEERYRAVVEQAGEGIFLFDPETKHILEANPAFQKMFGYEAEELKGVTLYDLVPQDNEGVDRNVERALERGYLLVGERLYRRKDGFRIDVEVSGSVISHGGKEVICSVVRDITERKRAEEVLRSSEARFRTLVEQSPLSIQILSPDGRTLRVNRAWEELFGVTLDEIEGYNLLEDRQLVDKGVMLRILRGFAGEPTAIPPIAYVPDETIPGASDHGEQEHWIQAFIYPVKDDANNVHEVVLMHEDVTDRKRDEEALRHSERSLATAQRIAHVGNWEYSVRKDTALWSDELYRIFGLDPQEFVPTYKGFLERTHLEDRGLLRGAVRKALLGKEPTGVVGYRIVRPGGEVRHVESQYELSRDAAGRPEVLNGTVQDVTERKRAEEALKESEERYRAVVEQAAEGIVLVDVETKRILETNAVYEAMLGYYAEEMRFLTLYDVVPYTPESMDCYVEKVLERRIYVSGERRHLRKNRTLVDVEVSASVISYGGREAMCMVVHDITERKKAEEALQEVREAERRRIARDMHDGVLQDISHALAEAQILRMIPEEPGMERLDLLIEALRRSARELRSVVYDLRQEEDAPGRSFVRSVESLVELNRKMNFGWDVELVVGERFPEGLPERLGRELLRVVQEALSNARKHSGAGKVRVALRVEGDDLVAEVEDDGRGFDPGLTRVGVGLSSMDERAAALGGDLEVASEPDMGTRVRLRIPLRKAGGGEG